MGEIVKQSLRGTIYLYVGAGLGFFISALIFPNILSETQIGLISVLLSYSAVFYQIFTLGINAVTIRLFPRFRDDKTKHHNGFLSIIIGVALTGFILSLIVYFFIKPWLISINVEKSPLLVDYLYLMIPLTFFSLFFSVLDVYYSALMHSTVGTFYKDVLQRIFILIVLAFFYFKLVDFKEFIWLYIAAFSLPTLLLAYSIYRSGHFKIHYKLPSVKKKMAKLMVVIASASILNSLSSIIIQSVDSIMINGKLGLGLVGIYTPCFFFGAAVGIPARQMIKISNAAMAQAWRDKNMSAIKSIYYKSCINQFIIGLALFLLIWVNVDSIFLILPEKYSAGYWVIFFIGLGNLIDMATGVNTSLISTSKYYWTQTIFMALLAIMAIVFNLIFIPIWGINGAAAGSALALALFNLVKLIFIKVKFGLFPYNIRFVYVTLVALAAYGLVWLIPQSGNFYIDIPVKSISFALLFGLPVYFFGLSPQINSLVDTFLSKIIKK